MNDVIQFPTKAGPPCDTEALVYEPANDAERAIAAMQEAIDHAVEVAPLSRVHGQLLKNILCILMVQKTEGGE